MKHSQLARSVPTPSRQVFEKNQEPPQREVFCIMALQIQCHSSVGGLDVDLFKEALVEANESGISTMEDAGDLREKMTIRFR